MTKWTCFHKMFFFNHLFKKHGLESCHTWLVSPYDFWAVLKVPLQWMSLSVPVSVNYITHSDFITMTSQYIVPLTSVQQFQSFHIAFSSLWHRSNFITMILGVKWANHDLLHRSVTILHLRCSFLLTPSLKKNGIHRISIPSNWKTPYFNGSEMFLFTDT